MSDEPIPLYDGEPTGAQIRHETSILDHVGAQAGVASTRRRSARHECERVHVCFSPRDADERSEHVECPVLDLSKGGLAIEFDRVLASGTFCTIAYRTISRQPVHVSGTVRHCRDIGGGRYRVGVKLNRELRTEELRPARQRPGHDVAPGVRARPLKPIAE